MLQLIKNVQVVGIPVAHYQTPRFGVVHRIDMEADRMAMPLRCDNGRLSPRNQCTNYKNLTATGENKENSYR